MSKSLKEFTDQLDEYTSFSVQYGSDYKLEPNGRGGYRKVRARRIKVGDKAPDPSEIDAPEVGDDNAQFRNAAVDIYKKYRRKYIQAANRTQNKVSNAAINPATIEDPVNESIEISQESLEEAKLAKKKVSDEPPFVLVLKRQNIRMYPHGLKVALYYNEKLGKHFTIPFGKGVSPNAPVIQAESISEDNFLLEQEIMKNLLTLYSNLSENNQKSLLKLVSEDYSKVKEFLETIKEGSNDK